MRLADGSQLRTWGQTTLTIDFGVVSYTGVFHVVPAQIPLILGMQFLGEAAPIVDWRNKIVTINGK